MNKFKIKIEFSLSKNIKLLMSLSDFFTLLRKNDPENNKIVDIAADYYDELYRKNRKTYVKEGKLKKKNKKRAIENLIYLNPFDILFTQNTIYDSFTDGNSIYDTIKDINNGHINVSDISYIRVFNINNKWYTLDNRRLYVFKQCKLNKIPAENVTNCSNLKLEFDYKNKSDTEGKDIKIIERYGKSIFDIEEIRISELNYEELKMEYEYHLAELDCDPMWLDGDIGNSD